MSQEAGLTGHLLRCGAVLMTGGQLLPRSPRGSMGLHGSRDSTVLPLASSLRGQLFSVSSWKCLEEKTEWVCAESWAGRSLSSNSSGVSEAGKAVCSQCVPETLVDGTG